MLKSSLFLGVEQTLKDLAVEEAKSLVMGHKQSQGKVALQVLYCRWR